VKEFALLLPLREVDLQVEKFTGHQLLTTNTRKVGLEKPTGGSEGG
jgi:hypothetical protein